MAVELVDPETVKEAVLDVVKRKPKYVRSLEKLLEVDEKNPEGEFWGDDSPTGHAWYAQHTGIPNDHLAYLVRRGIVTVFWKSNSTKIFCLTHPEVIKRTMQVSDPAANLADAAAPRAGLPGLTVDELWTRVYGYPKLKKWARVCLTSNVNFVLAGEPGSAKTVFLRDIGRLPGGFYRSAVHFSKAAMFDFLYYNDVQFLALDEADELDAKDWAHIYNMAWDGFIEKNVKDDYRHKEMKPVIILGLNNLEKLPKAIRKRFMRWRLDVYTQEEFVEVALQCLIEDEGVAEDLAQFIVDRLKAWTTDVRQAIMYGRMCHSEEEVLDLLDLDRERGV